MEKNVSGTTVMLSIRNTTKKTLEGVTVRDSVPDGSFISCPIVPKIQQLGPTSTLTWEILQLGPREEVTIRYETYHSNRGFSVTYAGKEYRG